MRKLMTVAEVADLLGVPVETVYCWRKRQYGPPAVRVGRHLRYDPADVWAWVKKRTA